jgi:hypothetical protein
MFGLNSNAANKNQGSGNPGRFRVNVLQVECSALMLRTKSKVKAALRGFRVNAPVPDLKCCSRYVSGI